MYVQHHVQGLSSIRYIGYSLRLTGQLMPEETQAQSGSKLPNDIVGAT
jgi:hypothetical protein